MKKQKNYTKGVAPIYIRITVNGKRAESANGRSCEPDRWNSKSGRSIGTKEDSRSLNSFLDQLQNMVYDAHDELLKAGYVITAESIKNRFMGRGEKSQTLLQAITEHNQKVEALVGKEFVQGTLNRYKVLKKHLEIFLPFKYDVKDMDMRSIDIAFLNEFDYYLRSEKSCANNYTVKMIKNLGKIINICFENGHIQTNPFAYAKILDIKVGVGKNLLGWQYCFLQHSLNDSYNNLQTPFRLFYKSLEECGCHHDFPTNP
ncbi:MAG: phage integrase SAM-like domain and Arm DNA-binding domain-containing protein [Bacteroidota bacterium]